MTDSLISGELRPDALYPARALRSGPPAAVTRPAPRTLLDVFAATVARCADRIAVDAPGERLTYAELQDAVEALARRLRRLGVGPGDKVGVRLPSGTAELYTAILGVLHSGAAYVPVDADDPPARAELVWQGSRACAVVGPGLEIAQIDQPRCETRPPALEDDAWVIFTSGSTGAPKGVAVTHRSAAAFVDAEASIWDVSPEDRVLAGLSVGFDASCEEMWLAWRHGAALVPTPRELIRAGGELGPWVADRGVSVISTVPTLAGLWDPADLRSVRLLILGGEACPEHLVERLGGPGRELWNTYGPTETTVVATATLLLPGEPVTIGWPLRGWEVAIVDEGGEPAALGEAGELVVAGVGLARYLDPDLDAARYAPLPALGWERAYRTGDIVRETIDGLRFIGRRDDQVKLGGRRIELGDVEAQLRLAPGVEAAAVTLQHTDAGNPVLVGYLTGDIDSGAVQLALSQHLPAGVAPVIVPLDSLPISSSGKVDRHALPWPPPAGCGPASELSGTAHWLADRWVDQLGPVSITAESDFFELGGSSLAAAKLASRLRERYATVAVADIYAHRTLGALAARLEELGTVADAAAETPARSHRGWAALQLLGVVLLRLLAAPQWLLGVLAVGRIEDVGPQASWLWLVLGWLVFVSVPGRTLLLAGTRRILLPDLKPGRYPRHSFLALRIWLVERMAALWRLTGIAGTPWAARYARLCGHSVARGARLFALPPAASLIVIGEDATVEADVDLEGWWIDGDDLVIDHVSVGPRARVGRLSVLMPGAHVGPDAELEPGSVLSERVPAGERWAGSPAARIGDAGEAWPAESAPRPRLSLLWRAMFVLGLAVEGLLPLAAAAPAVVALALLGPSSWSTQAMCLTVIASAPILIVSFLASYGLLIALLVRAVSPLLRPGWHPENGAARWALWLTDSLMEAANGVLFPLYASVYTRRWLRLLGVPVGRRAEVSVVAGLNRLTALGRTSMSADAAAYAVSRSRCGWMHLAPIEIGAQTFIGNGAILEDATSIGDQCLVGVLTKAPPRAADGTSWFGSPALELPRRPETIDPARTSDPPRRLVLGRGATELVRILLPSTLTTVLGALVFDTLEQLGSAHGLWLMAAATAPAFLAGGVAATLLTIAIKWLTIGRYRTGEHPLWSFFVWRDEIVNSCQDQLAGPWLIGSALATPLMSVYLRLMGAKVGRDVWCDTMTITEFDLVELGDRCVVNRHAIVEAHLFHDRLLRLGPVLLGPGSTVGPMAAVLPDTELGVGCSIGARSVVMRGERLPAGTRWHGSPVVGA